MNILKYKEWNEEFNRWRDKYLKKFGEHSLDRVITHDPLHFPFYIKNREEIDRLIEPLKEAIETNTPIEQADPELWKKIVF